VGAGFLSGAIVHIPLDPLKFIIIGLIGLVFFVGSTIINELKITKQQTTAKSIVRLILFSSILAIGVGMIAGGIQHFTEFPSYLSKIIPIGIVLSITGYVLGHGINLKEDQIFKLTAASIAVVAITALGLNQYTSYLIGDKNNTTNQSEAIEAETLPYMYEENTDGHGHGH
jgi:drug/metabolite transporter (DMT)-like permease